LDPRFISLNMKMTGNIILITGGGSGIGRALAESFHKLGNEIIIAGRGDKRLSEVAAANPGVKPLSVDLSDPRSIKKLAKDVSHRFPGLNAVIHCAGVMIPENLLEGKNFEADDNQTVATNLLGPIRLTEALLPTLRKQTSATILTVSSGLAFVLMALTPTYCATKAAIHSFTQSLRYQLRDTAIQVIELIPPYVATTLMGDHQAKDPRAMPLADYISETMELLKTRPDAGEILVERVHPLRFAARNGPEQYESFFKQFNDQVMAAAQGH
jgi:uncharacterized oxidoreductase